MKEDRTQTNLMLPSCRSNLTDTDYTFIVDSLNLDGHDPKALRDLLRDPEMRDLILDSKGLYRAVLESKGVLDISSELYFYLLVRHGLRQAMVPGRDLADYVATLLVESAAAGLIGQLRSQATFTHEYIVGVLEKSANGSPEERFMMPIRTGNYALLIAGFCADLIPAATAAQDSPNLRYYEAVGSASFRAACRYPIASEFMLSETLRSLGEHFHAVSVVLNRIADLAVPMPPTAVVDRRRSVKAA